MEDELLKATAREDARPPLLGEQSAKREGERPREPLSPRTDVLPENTMSVQELKNRLSGIASCDAAAQPLVVATEHAKKGCQMDATVPAPRVVDAARILDEAAFMIEAITGVDWLAEQQMEVVYDFVHLVTGARVTLRTRVPRAQPELPTISEIYPGANWHERETHDFFGIVFTGHPGLIPLLLPEDARFHPLRKDFAP